MGPSGSGKSTLLHCLAGIFPPDKGEIWFDGKRLDKLSDTRRTELRRTAFGFVFQFGQLVPELTVADNIALPLLLNRGRRKSAYAQGRGVAAPARAGRPRASGGPVSCPAARRSVSRWHGRWSRSRSVLFADEPTGSLDTLTGEMVMELLVGTAARKESPSSW